MTIFNSFSTELVPFLQISFSASDRLELSKEKHQASPWVQWKIKNQDFVNISQDVVMITWTRYN